MEKYGFACKCIVAYSVPFEVKISNCDLSISCSGQIGSSPKEKFGLSVSGNNISIRSLPIGCVSKRLPIEHFQSILFSAGLSADVANRLFLKIGNLNINARRNLVDSLPEGGFIAKSQLIGALNYEIELIENSIYS